MLPIDLLALYPFPLSSQVPSCHSNCYTGIVGINVLLTQWCIFQEDVKIHLGETKYGFAGEKSGVFVGRQVC